MDECIKLEKCRQRVFFFSRDIPDIVEHFPCFSNCREINKPVTVPVNVLPLVMAVLPLVIVVRARAMCD